ncbi:Dolichyl-phosphate beta-glucosyltransferase [Daphnia magna]|uniref:Dolichyl-phosphate beta-glucosyltransferase n=1 Tax=Daphnia magna TaxID=35525 RepID=A0A164YH96_9CRUS|nr:Dolichyl-phosphate beta-glucosyltransferase [Daphnia magna]
MKGFHLLVWLFAARSVRDTQCGFKLLTRPTARLCFPNLHIERWAFDVELIYIAEYMNIPTGEVSVRWMEIEGKFKNRSCMELASDGSRLDPDVAAVLHWSLES